MIHPVTTAENMTIKHRTTGFGLKRPGGGVAASCFEGDFDRIFQRGGGGVGLRSQFGMGRANYTAPPGHRPQ
jgi:hypothetical protein